MLHLEGLFCIVFNIPNILLFHKYYAIVFTFFSTFSTHVLDIGNIENLQILGRQNAALSVILLPMIKVILQFIMMIF